MPTDPVVAEHLVEALSAQQSRCLHEGLEFPLELVETLAGCRVLVSGRHRASSFAPAGDTAGRDAHHAGAHLLDLDEAAARLSYSRSTVERLVKSGALPVVRPPAGAVRVHSHDLEDFMDSLREKNTKAAAS